MKLELDRKTIVRLAHLAKFDLSEREIDETQEEFKSLMDLMSHLNRIDTEGIEPMVTPFEAPTRYLREDDQKVFLSHQEILENAPQAVGAFIEVPKVVDHES